MINIAVLLYQLTTQHHALNFYSMDFTDIFLEVKNDGLSIEQATKKVWSENKYRKQDDIKYILEAYPDDWAIVDKLMKIE